MSNPSDTPSARDYLAQVAHALHQSGATATDRDAILDGLREQIDDMCANPAQVPAALARLDPPERFAASLLQDEPELADVPYPEPPPLTQPPPAPRPLHTLGALSLATCLLGLLAGVAIGVGGGLIGVSGDHAGFVLFFGAQLLAIGLGLVSFKDPMGRGGLVAATLLLSSSLLLPMLFS